MFMIDFMMKLRIFLLENLPFFVFLFFIFYNEESLLHMANLEELGVHLKYLSFIFF